MNTSQMTTGADAAQDTNANEGWTEVTPTGQAAASAPKKRRKAKAAAAPQVEPAAETPAPKRGRKPKTPPVEEPAPVAALKKPKRSKGGATLQDVFAGYVAGLEAEGKSDGTIASYRMELQLAADDLGLETPVADLTPERVLAFMTSDRVMKKRSGKAKSPLSIDKTRRVLRQALQYAETAKLVATAPVPELAASH